jgi:hypothetical protein
LMILIILGEITGHEASCYAALSNLLSFHPS